MKEYYVLVIENFKYSKAMFIFDYKTHNIIIKNLTYSENINEINLQLLIAGFKTKTTFTWPTEKHYLEIELLKI